MTSKIEIIPSENGSLKQCVPPAVEQFPNPLLDKQSRQRGGLLLHIIVAFYMFVGLAIVCEDYFVPSLNKVSDGKPGNTISQIVSRETFSALGISPDVAGATFMAAGSSAPELATSVIGVFVAKSDIGVSGVVGSAVFNITLVVAVCSLCAPHPIQLSWYSVSR